MAEESFKRKLTAILSADVEGYSRLMGEDEDATIRILTAYRELMGCVQNRPNMNFQCKLNQYITSKDYELPIIYSIFHLHSIKMHIDVILVHHHSIAFPFL